MPEDKIWWFDKIRYFSRNRRHSKLYFKKYFFAIGCQSVQSHMCLRPSGIRLSRHISSRAVTSTNTRSPRSCLPDTALLTHQGEPSPGTQQLGREVRGNLLQRGDNALFSIFFTSCIQKSAARYQFLIFFRKTDIGHCRWSCEIPGSDLYHQNVKNRNRCAYPNGTDSLII